MSSILSPSPALCYFLLQPKWRRRDGMSVIRYNHWSSTTRRGFAESGFKKLTTIPILFCSAPGTSSTASPKTIFINWSYPRRVPLTFLPLLRWREMVLSKYDLQILKNGVSQNIINQAKKCKQKARNYLRFGPFDPIFFRIHDESTKWCAW